jgi:sec-independent protein translocase protein TatA
MLTNFGFLDFGTPELLIILAILLLLFGGKKLPQLSRSLGESMRELRKGLSDSGNEEDNTQKKKPKAADNKTS